MTRFINAYPFNWAAIASEAKALVGDRCVRCQHPFDSDGKPWPCDERCDPTRGRLSLPLGRPGVSPHDTWTPGLNYGVHHLDGDKANSAWWNLLALCNSCHLTFQARVIPEQEYMHPHSPWFRVYVAGYYAAQAGLVITRAEAEAHTDRFLAMGQPHLYEVRL